MSESKLSKMSLRTLVTNKTGIDLFGTRTVRVDLQNGCCLVYGEKDPMLKKLGVGRPVEISASGVKVEAFASKTSGRITSHVILEGAEIMNVEESAAATQFSAIPNDEEELLFVNIEERIAQAANRREEKESNSSAPDMTALAESLKGAPKQ